MRKKILMILGRREVQLALLAVAVLGFKLLGVKPIEVEPGA